MGDEAIAFDPRDVARDEIDRLRENQKDDRKHDDVLE